MANIYWPQSLPSGLLAEGFTLKPQSNVIRTRMDSGPQKARRRYTARTVKYTGKQRFNTEEFIIFEKFYHNELADGVLRFNFEDSVTMETAEFRFTDDYNISEFEGYFEVTMPLERL